MLKFIKKIVWYLLYKIKLAASIQLLLFSGLRDDGWYLSFYRKEAIDAAYNPIPWCTYSYIKFIEPRLKKNFSIFEYGSGNSTLWYAKRTQSVIAIEHDISWYEKIKNKMPSNVELLNLKLRPDGNYSEVILNYHNQFDIVIIDGRERNECAHNCLSSLKEDGVIVFDNTQIVEYLPAIQYLLDQGFKRIDFVGLLPIVSYNNTTTIFYKKQNCLGI